MLFKLASTWQTADLLSNREICVNIYWKKLAIEWAALVVTFPGWWGKCITDWGCRLVRLRGCGGGGGGGGSGVEGAGAEREAGELRLLNGVGGVGPGLLIVVAPSAFPRREGPTFAGIITTRRLLPTGSTGRQNCAVATPGEYDCGGHTCECMEVCGAVSIITYSPWFTYNGFAAYTPITYKRVI